MSDPIKEIEQLIQEAESMRRGDHISRIEYTGDDAINQIVSELNQVRQDFEKYRAEYATDKATQEHRAKIAERKGFWRGIFSNAIAAIIGGIVVYYWPGIIAFFSGIFQ